jgi:hypothetical protein
VASILIALIVFACLFGGVLLGMFLRSVMPEHHLDADSKDTVKLGMGFIATITALVLGLVTASAKNSYDAQDTAVKHIAAKVMLLDRALAQYGPETNEIRNLIRSIIAQRVSQIWPEDRSNHGGLNGDEAISAAVGEGLQYRIRHLVPQNDDQRVLQSQSLQIANDIMETRWLMLGGTGSSVKLPFLIVVVFWLTVIFGSFGLFAPRNATVATVLFICALSAAGAIFLILEMDQPFSGIMQVSSAPLRFALSHLGQ